METVEILATLANGGNPDYLPNLHEEPEESPVEILASLS